MTMAMTPVSLSHIVAQAKSQRLPFPVIVTPPGGTQRFGRSATTNWTVQSETQNRPLRVTLTYDPMTGRQTSRDAFPDKHIIDQIIGYGVAWHEGQLFGWVNQLIGVATALMLMALSVTGFVMWRRRKPEGQLGAPTAPIALARLRGVAGLVVGLAAVLPLLAASLLAMWLIERAILRQFPRLARWLGLNVADAR
jgi:uncharacterized iron-regulated membrane protein